jgi:hypothetical protein
LNNVRKATVRHAVLTTTVSAQELAFYIRRDFWGSSLSDKAGRFETEVKVPVEPLNEVVKQFNPTFVICDIEGAELDLVTNARWGGVTRVLLELHTRVIGGSGVKRLFEAMSARDFYYDQYGSNGSVVLFSRVKP